MHTSQVTMDLALIYTSKNEVTSFNFSHHFDTFTLFNFDTSYMTSSLPLGKCFVIPWNSRNSCQEDEGSCDYILISKVNTNPMRKSQKSENVLFISDTHQETFRLPGIWQLFLRTYHYYVHAYTYFHETGSDMEFTVIHPNFSSQNKNAS